MQSEGRLEGRLWAQVAWNFINDSLRTTICLQYAPRCVSAAAVHLAARYLAEKGNREFALPAHQGGKWYEAFQVHNPRRNIEGRACRLRWSSGFILQQDERTRNEQYAHICCF